MIPERGDGISMGILDICMFNPLGIQKSQLYKITTLNRNEQGLELPKFKRYRKITTLEIIV